MRRAESEVMVPWWSRLGLSLRTVLVLAFTSQIALVCSLLVWLTWTDGEAAVDEMAARLGHELTERVEDRLLDFLRTPTELADANVRAWRLGVLDVTDDDQALRWLREQLEVYPVVAYLSLGTAEGRFVGAERRGDGSFVYHVTDPDQPGTRLTHEVGARGERGRVLRRTEGYDPRARPWYTAAVEAGAMTWRLPYTAFADPDLVYLTVVEPVYDQAGDVLGVFGAELFLEGANAFLRDVARDTDGVLFIVERDGHLIASSGADAVLRTRGGEVEQQLAAESADPLVRAAAPWLGGATAEAVPRVLEPPEAEGRVFARFAAMPEQPGLDWVIGVMLPERALMQHVGESRRRTLVLCLGLVLLALLSAGLMGRSLARPLKALAERADRVRRGELDVSFPSVPGSDELAVLNRTLGEMVQGLRDRDVIRDAFGRYVSHDMAERLLENPSVLSLGGEARTVTVLLSDLRGFTGLSEHLPPQELVGLLNSYLAAMTEVIVEHRGTVIEFIGDAILAIFGAPFVAEDDAERAARCAIDMQLEMIDFNRRSGAAGLPELEMGIGLNTGVVVAGNIGSHRVAKYGVVGEAVNVAARIESLTVGSQILMGQETARAVEGLAVLGRARRLRVKGVSAALDILELRGVLGDPPVMLTEQDEGTRVRVDLRAVYQRVIGPQLEEQVVAVRVCELGERGVDLLLDHELEALEKICLRLELAPGEWTPETYATVVDVLPERGGRWRAAAVFTSLTPEGRRGLLRRVLGDGA